MAWKAKEAHCESEQALHCGWGHVGPEPLGADSSLHLIPRLIGVCLVPQAL